MKCLVRGELKRKIEREGERVRESKIVKWRERERERERKRETKRDSN